jgi:hypothetical protein
VGADPFSVEISKEGADIVFLVDDRWPEPFHLGPDALLDLARAWSAFVTSDAERAVWTWPDRKQG